MASTTNASTRPPVLDNPRGRALDAAVSVVLIPMTVAVFARLWGRYRYRTVSSSTDAYYRESRFWILLSDIAVVISYSIAVALTAVCYVLVHWGEGIHTAELSITQRHMVLMMFYVYQVLYKFVSGIAKIATLFLLLAISTSTMRGFNLVCKCFIIYIALYCVGTALTTVFQCGTAFESNWNKTLPQGQCFKLPPFWYSHAAINTSATMVMVVLPWWLFSSIQYRHKYLIAVIMGLLAVGETVLGAVRIYGLCRSSHSTNDLTYGTVTGILVSQIEVDFACIAACVPTVLKTIEEVIAIFFVHVLGRLYHRSRGESTRGENTSGSEPIDLSDLGSKDRKPRSHWLYTDLDKDELDGIMNSQERIIQRGIDSPTAIKVQTDVNVTVSNINGRIHETRQ
ncbi:conserved hypothetical protein [Talaromyces marneffei ATCC 18224]|uniref:Rhodopsin domain-containing protein n=1 Tax=Talaromyces marneffei (strain ATCC 18224 / CBS 334.59 / QM 7333) TaxID=441960 RepID=B6QSD5_TALMQ|nr:conserved hypothetical protein [Talaromyces marneffei ATCC 18224]